MLEPGTRITSHDGPSKASTTNGNLPLANTLDTDGPNRKPTFTVHFLDQIHKDSKISRTEQIYNGNIGETVSSQGEIFKYLHDHKVKEFYSEGHLTTKKVGELSRFSKLKRMLNKRAMYKKINSAKIDQQMQLFDKHADNLYLETATRPVILHPVETLDTWDRIDEVERQKEILDSERETNLGSNAKIRHNLYTGLELTVIKIDELKHKADPMWQEICGMHEKIAQEYEDYGKIHILNSASHNQLNHEAESHKKRVETLDADLKTKNEELNKINEERDKLYKKTRKMNKHLDELAKKYDEDFKNFSSREAQLKQKTDALVLDQRNKDHTAPILKKMSEAKEDEHYYLIDGAGHGEGVERNILEGAAAGGYDVNIVRPFAHLRKNEKDGLIDMPGSTPQNTV
jgi:predicted  nucleic acid-binding Zn-ribbon protein